jgi:hypothetical protein
MKFKNLDWITESERYYASQKEGQKGNSSKVSIGSQVKFVQ